LGDGRSPFSTTRLALPDVVGAVRNQRPHSAPSSYPKERGLFWSGSPARRQILLPAGDGQVQRHDLLAIPERPLPDQYPHARRAVVITDNAKYHHARLHKDWRQERAERFVLDFLPPYSPDLNPTERVWKLTRRLCLHNRYFPELDDVIQAVETEFVNWTRRNDTLRRLCAIT
jgi:transposase